MKRTISLERRLLALLGYVLIGPGVSLAYSLKIAGAPLIPLISSYFFWSQAVSFLFIPALIAGSLMWLLDFRRNFTGLVASAFAWSAFNASYVYSHTTDLSGAVLAVVAGHIAGILCSFFLPADH